MMARGRVREFDAGISTVGRKETSCCCAYTIIVMLGILGTLRGEITCGSCQCWNTTTIAKSSDCSECGTIHTDTDIDSDYGSYRRRSESVIVYNGVNCVNAKRSRKRSSVKDI